MKLWKKGMAVVGATVLAASLPLYSEASSNVTLTGKIFPKTGISLNFDSMDFSGSIGETVAATYKNEGVSEATPQLTVRYKDNYNVAIKSAALTGNPIGGGTAIDLDLSRITVNNTGLGLNPITIFSEEGMGTAAQKDIKDIRFSLNLTEEGFTDSSQISTLSDDTDVTGEITILLNGL